MGNNCSCKGCVISCIDKYSDCKDYINKEGKYNEKKPSEIKIGTSMNIQNILKTITFETEMKRNEVPKPEIKEAVHVIETKVVIDVPKPVIETKSIIEIKNSSLNLENDSTRLKDGNSFNVPLVKKTNKNSEDEFEIL
jgi:hypothetical protein